MINQTKNFLQSKHINSGRESVISKALSKVVVIVGIGLLLSSCSTNKGLTGAQALYRDGNAGKGASLISSVAEKQKIEDRDSEIIFIEQGNMLATIGDAPGANEAFKKADRAIKYNDDKAKVRLGSEAGALLTNLNSRPYRASPTERIMSAAYLAVTFADLESLTQARSAIALAKNRQREVNANFEKEIDKDRASLGQAKKSAFGMIAKNRSASAARGQGAVEKKKLGIAGLASMGSGGAFGQALSKLTKSGGGQQAPVSKARGTTTSSGLGFDDTKVQSTQNELLQEVAAFTGYGNKFIVPYADALGGVLLGTGQSADEVLAKKSFQRALDCYSSSKHLKAAMSGGVSGKTHVFIEDGVAPMLSSVRIDLPLSIDGAVTTFSAAFPKFVVSPINGSPATLSTGSDVVECDLICDFDRLAAMEYKKKLPGTIARTVASSLLKAVAGIAAQKGAGDNAQVKNILKVASVVYNVASAQADQRIWATLPKQVRYAQVATPASGEIRIGGEKVKLPEGKSNLVIARVVNGKVYFRAISL